MHFCEFSPNGKLLFTGSVDGTAKVWNVESDKNKKNADLLIALTDSRLIITLEEKKLYDKLDKQVFFSNVSYFRYLKTSSIEKWRAD